MTHYIPWLSRIVSGRRASTKGDGYDKTTAARVNVSKLAALLPELRRRLPIGLAMSDDALLASLVAIARNPTDEARWHAAEASTLGQHLAVKSGDRERDLVTLISLLPKPSL